MSSLNYKISKLKESSQIAKPIKYELTKVWVYMYTPECILPTTFTSFELLMYKSVVTDQRLGWYIVQSDVMKFLHKLPQSLIVPVST